MSPNTSKLLKKSPHHRWFVRHPLATAYVLPIVSLLICLLASELFLETFSGLGNPPLYKISPLYGYRLKANQVIEPKGHMGFLYGARITTNNLGLRAAEKWDSNPAGKILFLGDSVTYGGQYVSDSQLFTSLAKKRLPGWQVGNGAINGWGIENIAGLVHDYQFTPAEIMVICVPAGDFYRGLSRASFMPLWTKPPNSALQDLFMHFIWQINKSRYSNRVIDEETHLDKIVDRAIRRLKELVGYLQQQKVHYFLFILPTREQILGNELRDERVEKTLKKYQIDAQYLLPDLLAHEPDIEKRRAWFHDEIHLEPPGHKVYGIFIGDALSQALTDLKLYPPNDH